jgi:hypothetical protein
MVLMRFVVVLLTIRYNLASKANYRGGKVTASAATNYDAFCSNLEVLAAAGLVNVPGYPFDSPH